MALTAWAGCVQSGARPGDSVDATAADATSDGRPDSGSDADGQTTVCSGCVIADACRDEGELNPFNPCEVCTPSLDATSWSPIGVAKACDDNDPCTDQSACEGGSCVGALRPECDDLPECVTDVVCDGVCTYVVALGRCYIEGRCLHEGERPAGDVCRVCSPSAEPLGWTFTRATCDDGDACTYEDTCNGGVCAGQTNTCTDALACTLDFCDGGECQHQVLGGHCLIDGVCLASGAASASNACRVCDPLVSTSALSVANGASCNDGIACTPRAFCSAEGTCLGEIDSIDDEPNDALPDAQDIGTAVDVFPSGLVNANFSGPGHDYFRWGMPFLANGIALEPQVIVAPQAPTAIELCLYARCGQTLQTFATPQLRCDAAATSVSSLEAHTLGCCRQFSADEVATMRLRASCDSGVPLGFAYAAVFPTGTVDAATCGGYTLQWGAVE